MQEKMKFLYFALFLKIRACRKTFIYKRFATGPFQGLAILPVLTEIKLAY
ncbi:hypothetical protein SAMN05443529_12044 [Desulfosporosinus hippei DSM 8344]|uniref:Uncharacterized protein n=1 Tax=Desulfosporosinus hippei DSM 8344 TaxID=1121419 RepID=A0A1G8FQZ3_9FIRM|nr:hypothetical protein SAMN05443529_12044 [Desulfosporosinus hippei DSM 8344]